jgi:hypothetical protein
MCVASSRLSSVYVITSVAPLTAALANTGAVVSGVLLVTGCAAIVAASLPDASWMAFESLLPLGSVYATVTVSPFATELASLSVTVWAVALTETVFTVRVTPPTFTTNAPADGTFVASSEFSSVYVSTSVDALTAALAKTGAVVSGVALVTVVALRLSASLPSASWIALASLPLVGSA